MRSLPALLFVVLGTTLYGQATPRTLLWRITKAGTPRASYLYGTVHSQDDRAFQWGDSVFPALARVDLMAGELDLKESQRQLLNIMPLALMPAGETLEGLYKKREWKEVEAVLKEKLGMLYGMTSRLKPFFVILMLSGGDAEGSHERVLDDELMHRAEEMGKQVAGLETMKEQMAALDVLSIERQARLLLEYVRNTEADTELDRMLDAYAAQDLDALMRIMEASPTMPAEMDASLIVERNHRMASRMDSIIAGGTPSFFAIGSGHLPRKDGLIQLLRDRGYGVEPVFSSYTKPEPTVLPNRDDK